MNVFFILLSLFTGFIIFAMLSFFSSLDYSNVLHRATLDCMRRDRGEYVSPCHWSDCPNRFCCSSFQQPPPLGVRLKTYIQKLFGRFRGTYPEEDRCDVCADADTCPAFNTGVIAPCPHFRLW